MLGLAMYTPISSANICGGPPDICFANSTRMYMGPHERMLLFQEKKKKPLLIPGHTLHPFIHYVNSTGRTLGLVDVRCFFRELVAPLPYKYPHKPFFLSHHFPLVNMPPSCQKLVKLGY
jgi:hypothetical protein